jgi:hypothetical protein
MNDDLQIAGKGGEAEQGGDSFELGEPVPVCPNCLEPCSPGPYYCANCDGNEAMNPLATYMPYVRIRFQCGMFGKMLRTALYDKDTPRALRLIYLVACILFVLILP